MKGNNEFQKFLTIANNNGCIEYVKATSYDIINTFVNIFPSL